MKTIDQLLETRHESKLEWVEPWAGMDKDGCVKQTTVILNSTVNNCISIQRNSSPKADDRRLLEDFIAVHWAREVTT